MLTRIILVMNYGIVVNELYLCNGKCIYKFEICLVWLDVLV